MPLIKKKISEFPLADSLKGLYTIGYKIIDGIKTSVKVSLEDIQTAYQDVVNAIKKSEEATSNANNAAVTAEEKATAANVAAQEAEKIANNPTYIGKDHYVYVYNKDTESFDKTDIYCKGEPGSSFRVAGEYDTLEALKSAVPDGSAVDGFMAVGTEAPYDYYAWVSSAGGNNPDPSPDRRYLLLSDGTPLLLANEEPILLADNGERVASNGEWVNQGKIGGIDEAPTDGKAYGRKNGDWAEVPEHLNLTSENLNDINGAGFATQKSTADYTSPENNYPINENGALIFANANYGHSNQIYGSYLTNRWFARGSGNQQDVRTNWKEFAFTDDVLTKTNTSSFTPTGDYQPATKKYVDDKHIMLTITDEAHIQLISNQEVKAGEAESKINLVFGSIDNFKNIIQRLLSDNILFLKITEKEIFKVSTSHTYCNPDNGAYELSFIYTYTSIADANNISLVTKRIFIALNSNATNFFVVKDILVSDNLTTLTKKTAAEYEAIGSKDANTAYCVTD